MRNVLLGLLLLVGFSGMAQTDINKTDLENAASGKETTIDRTRRLFYVTCSRSKESLAILAYSSDPDKVVKHAIAEGWFKDDEIESI